MSRLLPLVLCVLAAVPACRGTEGVPWATEGDAVAEVGRVLDDFHDAAARADGERYFAHFDPEAVFLGTDATERWTLEEFRAFAEPYFEAGRGWTYHPSERHVAVSTDGRLAWFDERVHNEKYGETRGTGVLRRADGVWRIVQYNLTIPVPNELALDLVDRIRALDER